MEERIAAIVIGRMAAMDGMAGDDTVLLDAIAQAVQAGADREAV